MNGNPNSWADHRRLEDLPLTPSRSDFVSMPGGGLLLRGARDVGRTITQETPGVIAGLGRFLDRFRRKEPEPAPYWIPQPQPAAVAPAPAPVVVPTLPGYSDWGEIERETEREARIVRELGEFSKRVLADERLVGKER